MFTLAAGQWSTVMRFTQHRAPGWVQERWKLLQTVPTRRWDHGEDRVHPEEPSLSHESKGCLKRGSPAFFHPIPLSCFYFCLLLCPISFKNVKPFHRTLHRLLLSLFPRWGFMPGGYLLLTNYPSAPTFDPLILRFALVFFSPSLWQHPWWPPP